jgi:signal peptidase II
MNNKKFKKAIFYLVLVSIIFILDRLSKLYILNLSENSQEVDIYITSFLNLYLIWNTGVGFGLFSLEQSFFYNLVTTLIIFINIIIIFVIMKTKDYKIYFLLMVLGGSLGNLFDRLYYYAVPDFIDIHYYNFHWFVFNVADIFITFGIICLIFAEIFLNKDKKEKSSYE